jgi:hypothetical protein
VGLLRTSIIDERAEPELECPDDILANGFDPDGEDDFVHFIFNYLGYLSITTTLLLTSSLTMSLQRINKYGTEKFFQK